MAARPSQAAGRYSLYGRYDFGAKGCVVPLDWLTKLLRHESVKRGGLCKSVHEVLALSVLGQEVDKLCSEVLVKVAELEIFLAEKDDNQDWLRKALSALSRALQLDPSNLLAEASWHSICSRPAASGRLVSFVAFAT
eukprot:s2866_g1.t1